MLSVHDVALQLKVTDQHVRSLLHKDELKAEMVGKQWIITQDAVSNYIRNNDIAIEPDDHSRQNVELPNIIALSFFSGAMGLDIGMAQGGIKTLLACELDKTCRLTIDANKSEIALIGDINKYSSPKYFLGQAFIRIARSMLFSEGRLAKHLVRQATVRDLMTLAVTSF